MNISMDEPIRKITKQNLAQLMLLKEKSAKGMKKAVKFRDNTLILSIYGRNNELLDMYVWTSDLDYLECNFDLLVQLGLGPLDDYMLERCFE